MDEYETQALEASAKLYNAVPGYLLKTGASKDQIGHLIIDCIDALDRVEFERSSGPLFDMLDANLGKRKAAILAIEKKYNLTEREAHILRYLANDRNPTYIAKSLGISKATVKSHKYSIFKKLHVHSMDELREILIKNNR